ncbi:hypothetical protein Q2T83_07085 [Fervidibacter sacchari]|uniref:Uncharacterized protein n=1 Tax=Candidatus Fervidibacter sacchari TaxID=1448929 RepID=A0ABT2EL52_9BACT|nr:hypothetical protein [Candidatus Fervidibacter sacchari]MCS3918668.1 hypothetical protein [Candidatus Fervidibacter sacchari]WKU17576.1 hypothetical protein Q2T83_07085 [Candidatus Fervidibacter sacchari]
MQFWVTFYPPFLVEIAKFWGYFVAAGELHLASGIFFIHLLATKVRLWAWVEN